ncbi:MAG: hypothetical protein PWR32_39 [Candidatus Woesearchaeota archaeon]|nr:hypothetical protein [Candidatus Woesearchaeota archaeon]
MKSFKKIKPFKLVLSSFLILLIGFLIWTSLNHNLNFKRENIVTFVPVISKYISTASTSYKNLSCKDFINLSNKKLIKEHAYNRTVKDSKTGSLYKNYILTKVQKEYFNATPFTVYTSTQYEYLNNKTIFCGIKKKYVINSSDRESLKRLYQLFLNNFSKKFEPIEKFQCENSDIEFILGKRGEIYGILGVFTIDPDVKVSYNINDPNARIVTASEWFKGEFDEYVLFTEFKDISPLDRFRVTLEYILDHVCYPKERQKFFYSKII